MTTQSRKILIIDDTPTSLRLLLEILSEEGYTVHPTAESELGLQFAENNLPDLILLDVMMPGMDGYELCKRLKSNERTREIPVIFISAADQILDKVKAFSIGGVDYITKPFQVKEVLARVATHLTLRKLQKNLEKQVKERTHELEATNAQLRAEIAERKRTEAALRGSEERYRALYQDNPSMFFTVNADGMVVSVNDFGASQLGYTIDELEGQSVLDVFYQDDKAAVIEQLRTCLQRPGQIYRWEFRKVHKDGSLLWVEEFARAVSAPGNVHHVLIVCQDITERKQAEAHHLELALEREKVSFLQDFLGVMAHDLKTPIAVMKTRLHLLEKLADPHKQKEWANSIHIQLNTLNKIVDDVLTVAKLETLPQLTFQSVDINHLITDIEYRLRSKIENKQLRIVIDLSEDLPIIQASEDELYRALLNLIENAVNYTPEQGTLKIQTDYQNMDVRISVADTGIGIKADDLPRIFDEFYRASNARAIEGGTGLGLAITKKVIDLHKGHIEVQSTVGVGTTFIVSLPLVTID